MLGRSDINVRETIFDIRAPWVAIIEYEASEIREGGHAELKPLPEEYSAGRKRVSTVESGMVTGLPRTPFQLVNIPFQDASTFANSSIT